MVPSHLCDCLAAWPPFCLRKTTELYTYMYMSYYVYVHVYVHVYVYVYEYVYVYVYSRRLWPSSRMYECFSDPGRLYIILELCQGRPPVRAGSGWRVLPAANLCTKILDFRGFDSNIILILRGGILMSIGVWRHPCCEPALLPSTSRPALRTWGLRNIADHDVKA